MAADIEALRAKIKQIESAGRSSEVDEQDSLFSGGASFEALVQDDLPKRIRWSAMELLSRREHSARELTNKLKQRYSDHPADISSCVQALSEEGLQSDDRYCEAYVAMRKRKGYGPQRIMAELREKGVAEGLAKSEVYEKELDWYGSAFEVWQKKFRETWPQDAKEKAKQIRFLSYRGFSQSHINEIYS